MTKPAAKDKVALSFCSDKGQYFPSVPRDSLAGYYSAFAAIQDQLQSPVPKQQRPPQTVSLLLKTFANAVQRVTHGDGQFAVGLTPTELAMLNDACEQFHVALHSRADTMTQRGHAGRVTEERKDKGTPQVGG